MKESKQRWLALHAVIVNELNFRLGSDDWAALGLTPEDLADNLTDVVIAHFELTPRRG
jgi:hypothetical protein